MSADVLPEYQNTDTYLTRKTEEAKRLLHTTSFRCNDDAYIREYLAYVLKIIQAEREKIERLSEMFHPTTPRLMLETTDSVLSSSSSSENSTDDDDDDDEEGTPEGTGSSERTSNRADRLVSEFIQLFPIQKWIHYFLLSYLFLPPDDIEQVFERKTWLRVTINALVALTTNFTPSSRSTTPMPPGARSARSPTLPFLSSDESSDDDDDALRGGAKDDWLSRRKAHWKTFKNPVKRQEILNNDEEEEVDDNSRSSKFEEMEEKGSNPLLKRATRRLVRKLRVYLGVWQRIETGKSVDTHHFIDDGKLSPDVRRTLKQAELSTQPTVQQLFRENMDRLQRLYDNGIIKRSAEDIHDAWKHWLMRGTNREERVVKTNVENMASAMLDAGIDVTADPGAIPGGMSAILEKITDKQIQGIDTKTGTDKFSRKMNRFKTDAATDLEREAQEKDDAEWIAKLSTELQGWALTEPHPLTDVAAFSRALHTAGITNTGTMSLVDLVSITSASVNTVDASYQEATGAKGRFIRKFNGLQKEETKKARLLQQQEAKAAKQARKEFSKTKFSNLPFLPDDVRVEFASKATNGRDAEKILAEMIQHHTTSSFPNFVDSILNDKGDERMMFKAHFVQWYKQRFSEYKQDIREKQAMQRSKEAETEEAFLRKTKTRIQDWITKLQTNSRLVSSAKKYLEKLRADSRTNSIQTSLTQLEEAIEITEKLRETEKAKDEQKKKTAKLQTLKSDLSDAIQNTREHQRDVDRRLQTLLRTCVRYPDDVELQTLCQTAKDVLERFQHPLTHNAVTLDIPLWRNMTSVTQQWLVGSLTGIGLLNICPDKSCQSVFARLSGANPGRKNNQRGQLWCPPRDREVSDEEWTSLWNTRVKITPGILDETETEKTFIEWVRYAFQKNAPASIKDCTSQDRPSSTPAIEADDVTTAVQQQEGLSLSGNDARPYTFQVKPSETLRGAGNGLWLVEPDITETRLFQYRPEASSPAHDEVLTKEEYDMAAKACVSDNPFLVFNMIRWMLHGPCFNHLMEAAASGTNAFQSSRNNHATRELHQFVSWTTFLIENRMLDGFSHITSGELLKQTLSGIFQTSAVPTFTTNTTDTKPSLALQQELASLLFAYLSRYMVTVSLQVPQTPKETRCFVQKEQVFETLDHRASHIPIVHLQNFIRWRQANYKHAPTERSVNSTAELFETFDRNQQRQLSKPYPPDAKLYEYQFVCDGNQESNHLYQVIHKALNANVDSLPFREVAKHDGSDRWTQWKAARPTLMATANDPNYSERAGKPTNADIVSTLQMYETGAFKVLAGVRIRHAVPGEEIFLSYHSGQAKRISLLKL